MYHHARGTFQRLKTKMKMERTKMTKFYFAEDGNYGDAENLLVVDGTMFTEAEWEEIETAHDGDRIEIVLEMLGERNA